jgi:hypothetical protein
MFGLRCCCCAAAGKIVTVAAINSDRRQSQILLPAVMSELPFFEKLEGIPIYRRLCVGRDIDWVGSEGILDQGETPTTAIINCGAPNVRI